MDREINAFFGGRRGLIQLLAGGQLETKPDDRLELGNMGNEVALFISHNDRDETQTVVPWNAIAWVRVYGKRKVVRGELDRGMAELDEPDISPREPDSLDDRELERRQKR